MTAFRLRVLLTSSQKRSVGAVSLDHLDQFPGQRQRWGAPDGAGVLGEGVHRECLGVDLLAVVHHCAVGVHRPEDAAVDGIDEVVEQGVVGEGRGVQVARVAEAAG